MSDKQRCWTYAMLIIGMILVTIGFVEDWSFVAACGGCGMGAAAADLVWDDEIRASKASEAPKEEK